MMDDVSSRDAHAEGPDLAALARLLADSTRADFCLALLDGRAWTAIELARHAGVAASTATEHLNLLVAGGLLAQERQGRHRYVRLADPATAELIENLASMAPRRAAPPHSLPASSAEAGRWPAPARATTTSPAALGVAITTAMTDRRLLDWEQGLTLTGNGTAWLDELGITLPPDRRRPPVRSCLDWTERRPHLAERGRCRRMPSRLRLRLDHSDRNQPRRRSHRHRRTRVPGPPRPVRRLVRY